MAIAKKIADGDVPLVTSFSGSEVEFGAKQAKANSRMSTLLFWQGRGKNGAANGTTNGKNWIHAPDALVKGHVAYLVKFLGCTQVDQPKGIEVIKDAVKKLQFAQQLKKSEAKDAAKCKKVEITISVDGVAIQEPRTNNILYQFPLHRISYCADDKGAKKYFSFIAKESMEPDAPEKHECFVFISTKLASEITLTIGQAFDLAYRRFQRENGKFLEVQKFLIIENKKLELQMKTYKTRLQELSKITYKDDLNAYLTRNSISNITEFKVPLELEQQIAALSAFNQTSLCKNALSKESDSMSSNSNGTANSTTDVENLLLSTPPPMHNGRLKQNGKTEVSSKNPVVGTKLEGLLLNSDSDSDFDPRAYEAESTPRYSTESNPPPLLAPPPKTNRRHSAQQQTTKTSNGSDLFGSAPFSQTTQFPPSQTTPNIASTPNYDIADFNLQTSVFMSGYDPFDTQKMGVGFGGNLNGFPNMGERQTVQLNSSFNGFLDKTISEMKDGFSRGISFGNDDFSLDTLDPLKKN